MAPPDSAGGRGSGGAGARGAFLLVVALVLGIVLLQKFDTTGGGRSLVKTSGPTTTTTIGRTPRTSLVPPTTSRALRANDQVKVLVANGTNTGGLAGRVTDLLKSNNYNALSPVDATKLVDATVVEYKADFEPEARAIARLLLVNSLRPIEDAPPVDDTRGADVLVIAGPDLRLPGDSTSTTKK